MTGLFASRRLRWVLLVFACLAAIALFLLATATANTDLFARHYDTLLLINGALVALLMLVVGGQLLQLRRNLKTGVFGSRLALRLVLLFSLVAVLPGALVYAVSVQFLGKSIESWFDVRVDRALEGGVNLGRSSLDYLLKETSNRATLIASALADAPGGPASALATGARSKSASTKRRCFRRPAACSPWRGWAADMTPEPRPAQALRRARLQQTYAKVEQTQDAGLMLRVVVPVNSGDRMDPLRVLQVIEPVPRTLAQDLEKVQAGARDYQEISFSRAALKRLYADYADVDAAARADLGAGACRRAVGALRGTARTARGGHARGRARRFHAPATRDVARRARRPHRIVQYDDRATRRRAGEDGRIAPRDGNDARLPRKHARQPVGGRAGIRRSLSVAHGESRARP